MKKKPISTAVSILFFLLILGIGPVQAATYTVTSLVDDGSLGTFRWAVTQAADSDHIVFSPGLTGQITLLSNLPALNSVTFENAGTITLSRDHTSNLNVLTVASGKILSGMLPKTINASGTGNHVYGLYSPGHMSLDDISGSVTATAGTHNAHGLFSAYNMTLNNISGTVTATAGTSSAYGFFSLSNCDMSLNNISGSVTATAGTNWAFGLSSTDDLTLNDMSGSVTAVAGTHSAYGIYSSREMVLNNISGTVTAIAGEDTAAGLLSLWTLAGPGGSATLISGQVEARANGLAMAVGTAAGMNLRVTGSIKAEDTSGGGQAYAIATVDRGGGTFFSWTLGGLAFDDRVVLGNGAEILGKIDLGGGVNTLTFEDSGTLTGDVSNITTLAKTGTGTWQTKGGISTRDLFVTGGTLVLDDSATHRVSNDLSISPGTSLSSMVRQIANPSVTANTLVNNGEMNFFLDTQLPSGTTFDVLTTTAGITGTGSLDAGTPLLEVSVVGNNIQVQKLAYTDLPLYSANARTMAELLNHHAGIGTGEMAVLLTRLERAPSVDEFNTCLEQLNALSGPGIMTMETARIFSLSAQDRMAGVRTRQKTRTFLNPDDPETWPLLASAGNLAGLFNRRPDTVPNGVFVKTLNQKGSRDSYTGYTGYGHATMGLTGGFDRVLSSKFLTGLSLGVAKSDLDYEDAGGSHASVDNLGAGLYASLFGREWYLDALVSGNRGTSHADRNIAFLNQTAQSDQDGYALGAKLDSGYRFLFGTMGISPLLSAEYLFSHQGAYNETGAGAANLTVGSLDSHSFKTGLGLKADLTFKPNGWWTLTPEVSAQWLHEFIDQNQGVQTAMAGMPNRIFTQEIFGPKEDALQIKVGITAFYETNLALLFHYLGEFENGAKSHGLTCELQYFF